MIRSTARKIVRSFWGLAGSDWLNRFPIRCRRGDHQEGIAPREAPQPASRLQKHPSGISGINKDLCRKRDHGCVLFVQHLPKNALGSAFPCGSFIACEEPFGNCEDATEGGIPKSSRSGHSLKSLAFSGCVRRRDVA